MKAAFTILLVLLVLLSAAAAEIFKQEATPGENVTLRCKVGSSSINTVEWTRTDLKESEYVLLYRDGNTDPKKQHESFTNRVQLVDGQPKDGDVSLLLMNVTNNDDGTYECRVVLDGSTRKKRAIIEGEPIKTIQLTVKEIFNQTATPGQNVTLRCKAGSSSISTVEWTRTDLKESEYVFLNSDGRLETKKQHESFKNRVQLVDRELKDGDVSLLLKTVTNNDNGTYECRVKLDGSRRNKRAIIEGELIKTIQLTVQGSPDGKPQIGNPESGNPESGNLRLVPGLIVGAVLVACIAVLLWKHRRFEAERHQPSAAAPETVKVLLA